MPITIRLATATDFEAVAALRLAAYRAAPEFTVTDEAAITRWDGQVLVAENEEGLLATMQVVYCESLEEMRQYTGSTPAPVTFTALPTLILKRGATWPGRYYQGLNSRLRLAALEMAQTNTSIKSLSGFVYDGAPRLNLLRQLGYSFTLVLNNFSDMSAHTSIFFVALQRPQFALAAEHLRQMLTLA